MSSHASIEHDGPLLQPTRDRWSDGLPGPARPPLLQENLGSAQRFAGHGCATCLGTNHASPPKSVAVSRLRPHGSRLESLGQSLEPLDFSTQPEGAVIGHPRTPQDLAPQAVGMAL